MDPVRQAYDECQRRHEAAYALRDQEPPDTAPPPARPVESLTAGALPSGHRPETEDPIRELWLNL